MIEIDIGSFLRGLCAMRRDRDPVNVSIDMAKRGWWLCLWTPAWHKGRGPYVSVGFGFGAFYRGY